jgi:hypothetical protein
MLPLHCPYALPQGRVGFGSGSPRIHVPSLFGDAAWEALRPLAPIFSRISITHNSAKLSQEVLAMDLTGTFAMTRRSL